MSESNAMLFHLAEGSEYLSSDHWKRAQTLQWLFFEQNSVGPSIAVVRFWHQSSTVEENRYQLDRYIDRGHRALKIIEDHLSELDFFVEGG